MCTSCPTASGAPVSRWYPLCRARARQKSGGRRRKRRRRSNREQGERERRRRNEKRREIGAYDSADEVGGLGGGVAPGRRVKGGLPLVEALCLLLLRGLLLRRRAHLAHRTQLLVLLGIHPHPLQRVHLLLPLDDLHVAVEGGEARGHILHVHGLAPQAVQLVRLPAPAAAPEHRRDVLHAPRRPGADRLCPHRVTQSAPRENSEGAVVTHLRAPGCWGNWEARPGKGASGARSAPPWVGWSPAAAPAAPPPHLRSVGAPPAPCTTPARAFARGQCSPASSCGPLSRTAGTDDQKERERKRQRTS